ncbi:phosphatidylglycerophosphatase [Stappia sp. F7233]|uniref:Phosphatidylglycerophosphatase n=1 Tax=Stappia albiluteola TaxID=2758565 RepID=A0A839AGK9_9HYPH|nr:phosphatidylglycerophosphatase [Stappia albiluteola]MBA5778022.1 phosphatidylglycerophosphatase [Stappia albiluteola]
MTDPSQALTVLLGLPGLLNPFALLIGAVLGWYANARAKLFIAGFAAAALSVLLDAAMNTSGISPIGGYQGGALAVFPLRFLGAGLMASIVFAVRQRIRNSR